MSDNQDALRIADFIDFPNVHYGYEAAAELRRLHTLNTELVGALRSVVAWMDAPDESAFSDKQLAAVRAALAKVEAST